MEENNCLLPMLPSLKQLFILAHLTSRKVLSKFNNQSSPMRTCLQSADIATFADLAMTLGESAPRPGGNLSCG